MTEARDGDSPASPSSSPPSSGGWAEPLGLLAFVFVASVFRMDVLIGIPFVLLVLALRVNGFRGMALAIFFGFLVALGSGEETGLWYVERAWALMAGGWFTAISLRWSARSFIERGIAAMAGSVGVFGLVFLVRPDMWRVIDWRVGERMTLGASRVMEGLDRLVEEPLPPDMLEGVFETVRLQIELFPAVLGLGTLAALGLAWWMYGRWGRGWSSPLGPVREFRFSDHLVWVLIGGLVLTLVGLGPAWERAGLNALVFMGALYALRGVAVVLFVSGGLSILGTIAATFAVLFMAPLVGAAMLVIGVGDTWLDLRERTRTNST